MVRNPVACQATDVQGRVQIPCKEYAFFAFGAFAFFTHKASEQFLFALPLLPPLDLHMGELLRTIAAEL